MKCMNRRDFAKQTAQLSTGIAAGAYGSALFSKTVNPPQAKSNPLAIIPFPIQVVIDDVGWWSGQDGSAQQEPYRTGIQRNHVPADYQAIVDLGRALNIRPQAAMVLCEWDKENILRQLPTSTWMGESWDNSKWVGPWMDEAADIIRSNSRFFEFTIHGIGHEYWTAGKFTRAEWADNDGVMRPRDQVEKHLDYFARLMAQHRLGELPESFVPTAFRHSFGRSQGRDVSLAELLQKHGVTYINTPFRIMKNAEAIQHQLFGFDAGVMTVDRGQDLFEWKVIGATPDGDLQGPTCGMHWPNLLHATPDRNSEVVQRWVKFLKPYNHKPETMLAPDSLYFRRQLAHHVCTKVKTTNQSIELDFTQTDALPNVFANSEFMLRIISANPLRFHARNIRLTSESSQKIDGSILYSLELQRKSGKKNASLKLVS